MANSPELSEGRFSFNQFVVSFSLSLHLVHLPLLFLFLPFCPLPLSGNKAAFSFQSCPSIVGSGVRIQWSCRCPLPSPGPTNTFYSVSVFLFVPRVFFRLLVCFSPGSALACRRFCKTSCPVTVAGLVLCHDAVFGWSLSPSSSFLLSFLLSTTSARMQSRTVYSPASPPPCQLPQECPATRIAGLANCLTLTFCG